MKFNKELILKPYTVVHCDTVDQAHSFLTFAKENGIKWKNGDEYSQLVHFSNQICFCLHEGKCITKASVAQYRSDAFTILEFNDVLIPEDKTFPQMMLVSDNGADWFKKEVIYIHKDNSCVCFEDSEQDEVQMWKSCKEIPEPKTRKMTNVEIFKAISNGAVVRAKLNNFVSNIWWDYNKTNDYQICYDYTENNLHTWLEMEFDL